MTKHKEEQYYRLISILRQKTEEEELGCSINAAHQQTIDFKEEVAPILERYFQRKQKLRLRLEREMKRKAKPPAPPAAPQRKEADAKPRKPVPTGSPKKRSRRKS